MGWSVVRGCLCQVEADYIGATALDFEANKSVGRSNLQHPFPGELDGAEVMLDPGPKVPLTGLCTMYR